MLRFSTILNQRAEPHPPSKKGGGIMELLRNDDGGLLDWLGITFHHLQKPQPIYQSPKSHYSNQTVPDFP